MPTLLLSQKDIRGLLSMAAVIAAVEEALRDHALGQARMPHKVYLDTDCGDFRALPALRARPPQPAPGRRTPPDG